jgi:hypothetical protein
MSFAAIVLRTVPVAAILIASTAHASPGERDKLNACHAMVDRVAQARRANTVPEAVSDAELARCRQIIREWTLRDSRMSVDEQGRPLR